jgi:hypothetical protein
MADIIKPDFNSIKYYKQTQHWWVSNNFDKLGLGDVKNIGSLMDFCHKKKPKDLEDFWWKWIKLPSNQKRFLNLLSIISKARPRTTEKDNINTLFIGLFYNTLLGYLAESKIAEDLLSKNYKVYKSNKTFDKKYAIDFVIISPEGVKTGVQVKSDNSRYNNSTNYINRNQYKMAKFKDKFNIDTIYAYYTHSYDGDNKTFNILGYSFDN